MSKYGILSRNRSAYTSRDKLEGIFEKPQPQYWNQGVGRIRAIPRVLDENIFGLTFDNTFN